MSHFESSTVKKDRDKLEAGGQQSNAKCRKDQLQRAAKEGRGVWSRGEERGGDSVTAKSCSRRSVTAWCLCTAGNKTWQHHRGFCSRAEELQNSSLSLENFFKNLIIKFMTSAFPRWAAVRRCGDAGSSSGPAAARSQQGL